MGGTDSSADGTRGMRKQGAINLSGALIKITAAVVATALTVRFCGLDEFGRWAFMLSVATILSTGDFGLPTTVNVYVSRAFGGNSAASISARVSFIALSSLAVALVMGAVGSALVLIGPHVAATRKFFNSGQSDPVLAASMALFVASRILGNVAGAFLQAAASYRAFVLIGLTFVLPTAIGMPVAAFYGFDADAFLHVHTVFSVISFFGYLSAASRLQREYAWRFIVDLQEWTSMAKFGIGSWLASTGGIIFSQLDRVVIGLLLNTQQLGVYAAATQVTSQINTLSAFPIQPLLPYVSRYAHDISRHLSELRALVSDAVRVNTAVALAFSGLVAIWAPGIARFLVEPMDAPAVTTTLRILAVIYGAYSLNAVGFYVMFATRDLKRLSFITIGSGFLTLAAIAVGARVAGLTGAAVGNALFLATLSLTVLGLRRFRISVTRWLTMIVVPLCGWGATLAIVFAVDVLRTAAALIATTIFFMVLTAWMFLQRESNAPWPATYIPK